MVRTVLVRYVPYAYGMKYAYGTQHVYYLSVYGVDSGCSRPFYAPLNSLTRLASDSERVGYARLPGRNEHVTGVLKEFPIHRERTGTLSMVC